MSDIDLVLIIAASVFAGNLGHTLIVVGVQRLHRLRYMRKVVKRLTAEIASEAAERRFFAQLGNIEDAGIDKKGIN